MTSWLVRAVTRRENNLEAQRRLIDDLQQQLDNVAAVALVGDLVYNARSRRDWIHFDTLLAPVAAEVPLLPALGNHDYHCIFMQLCSQRVVPKNARMRFPWLAPGRPYWTDFGALALVFLDSETAIAEQGAWLSDLLDRLDHRFRAVVVFVHRPPYTDATTRGLSPALDIRTTLAGAFADRNVVPLIVSGHAHGYEHHIVDGVHYLVTAGGGGPRGWLSPDRPFDVYTGRVCETDTESQVRRPFNYMLMSADAAGVHITVRGFCRADTVVGVLESFSVAFQMP